MSEKPVRDRPRRLADWLNPAGDKKVHSLVDKVYKRKNLEVAWIGVKRNGGAGGVDEEDKWCQFYFPRIQRGRKGGHSAGRDPKMRSCGSTLRVFLR